jgi:hypothetical protein
MMVPIKPRTDAAMKNLEGISDVFDVFLPALLTIFYQRYPTNGQQG